MYGQSEKKLIKQQCLPHMSPYNMVNFGPLAAEIVSLVWGTPGNFNGFRVLSTLLQQRRSTEVNQTLHYVCRLLAWYAIYTLSGSLSP